jgi:hypothetical protein
MLSLTLFLDMTVIETVTVNVSETGIKNEMLETEEKD